LEIVIDNCNNIDSGKVEITEGILNIKYAINGTGKTTLSRAICASIHDRNNGTNELATLTPFKAINDDSLVPSISGDEALSSFQVFDEAYINEFVFQPDELLKGSFDILIRDENYDAVMTEIEALVSEIKLHFTEDAEIEALINDFTELSESFGKPTKTGVHAASPLAKGFKDGNKVANIPEGLEIFKDYIQADDNFKWVKWQLDGKQFIDRSDNCPYCVHDVVDAKDTIKKVSEVYNAKTIQNLNKIVAVFQRLNKYFSDATKANITKFIDNIDGYTEEQVDYLNEIKGQVDRLNDRFHKLKSIDFFSFKDVAKVIDELKVYRIAPDFYAHLQSAETLEKIEKVNTSIDELIAKAGLLQGKINIQNKHIEKLVEENKQTINSFLKNAGYKYNVDLIEDESGRHRLKLIHTDLNNSEINEVRTKLSYGERNAFALVLFMFDAVKNSPDLIILDDPISSFDKNKKYAIVEMLFRSGKSFRGKTVLLLTHDFEPIVDMLYHHSDRFDKPFTTFIENKNGQLVEKTIDKNEVQTFVEINSQNVQESDCILVKLVYLRRLCEISNSNGMGYQLISNALHKRVTPLIFESGSSREMTPEEILEGSTEIQRDIPEFNYDEVMSQIIDDEGMKARYNSCQNNYEKLHLYRILYSDKQDAIQADIIQKFINQAFHIENDYIYQLNPTKFQTVPQYVIEECDRFINA
jgi:ABC-type dipeptide/oligopeptide/nickel transport system ATPase subunit